MRTIYEVRQRFCRQQDMTVVQGENIIYVAPSQMMQTGTRDHSHVQVFQVSERGHNLGCMDRRGVAIQSGGEGKKYKDFSEAIEDIRDGFYGAFVGELNELKPST